MNLDFFTIIIMSGTTVNNNNTATPNIIIGIYISFTSARTKAQIIIQYSVTITQNSQNTFVFITTSFSEMASKPKKQLSA